MVIDLHGVSWRRNGKTILNQITWQVEKGEHWALVGLNGSGKTTLLNLVNGYIWPTEGMVSILGRTFGETDLRELRKEIGWVSSALGQRISGQVITENIVLSGKFASIGLYEKQSKHDRARALAHMSDLGCEHLIGRTYTTLSQGERQRILIARALMASPQLLILDEPCTGLDLLSREKVLHMIEQITKSSDSPTVIYVTHHIEEISPCFTHVFLIRNGQKFASNRREEILNTECLTEFFQTPITVHEEKNKRKWVTLH